MDGLLSASLLTTLRGARLIGVYTTTHVLLFDGASRADARDALWLDHDISHPGVRCIGQHLVLHDAADALPLRHPVSFNPNLHFRQTFRQSFRGFNRPTRDKYPFATIHFLMEALGTATPVRNSPAFALLAHADGSWVSGLDYRPNARHWVGLMFAPSSVPAVLATDYTADPDALHRHELIVSDLADAGVHMGKSRVKVSPYVPAPWSPLEGWQSIRYQVNWDQALWLTRLVRLSACVSRVMGWSPSAPTAITDRITGEVLTPYPDSIPPGSFDSFMAKERIFSHAFTGFRTLRYTRGISLP